MYEAPDASQQEQFRWPKSKKTPLDRLFAEIDRLVPLAPDTCDLRCALRQASVEYANAVREQTAATVQAIYRGTR